jgi:hypothetical protein
MQFGHRYNTYQKQKKLLKEHGWDYMISEAPYSVTVERMDKILTFLPLFEKPGFSAGECILEKGKFPYCKYTHEVHAFISTLYDDGWICHFDWSSWQKEAIKYVNDPSELEFADLDTLRKLLTLHMRKERFCEGYMIEMIESGHLVAILKRLQTIRDSMK